MKNDKFNNSRCILRSMNKEKTQELRNQVAEWEKSHSVTHISSEKGGYLLYSDNTLAQLTSKGLDSMLTRLYLFNTATTIKYIYIGTEQNLVRLLRDMKSYYKTGLRDESFPINQYLYNSSLVVLNNSKSVYLKDMSIYNETARYGGRLQDKVYKLGNYNIYVDRFANTYAKIKHIGLYYESFYGFKVFGGSLLNNPQGYSI